MDPQSSDMISNTIILFVTLAFHNSKNDVLETVYSNFNSNWKFINDSTGTFTPELFNHTKGWKTISLLHTAQNEPLIIEGEQWQGTCVYRKFLNIPSTAKGKHIGLKFEAAMRVEDIYQNGTTASILT